MHTLQPSDATIPSRFRGPTFEDALAVAAAELGSEVEVIGASRIRRGGLGGFFATDLGVEVAVRPATGAVGGSAEQSSEPASAIERLLAQAEATERAGAEPDNFAAVLAGELGASSPSTPPAPGALGRATAEWSAEAYRQLAIPATATRPAPAQPAAAPAPAPTTKRARAATKPSAKSTAKPTTKATTKPTTKPTTKATAKPATKRARTSPAAAPAKAASSPAPDASEAVAALLAQLTAQVPPSGSLAQRITTLTVKVTTPSGGVVEISAALGAAS